MPDSSFAQQSQINCNSISSSLSPLDSKDTQTLHANSKPRRIPFSKISILSVNIRCLLKNLEQLIVHLNSYAPNILSVQETWLNKATEEVNIPGYKVVSRRDRKCGENRGGIATYQRHDFNGLVHIADCEEDERSWHFLRLDMETFLVANWY